jgi:hypothetical protein
MHNATPTARPMIDALISAGYAFKAHRSCYQGRKGWLWFDARRAFPLLAGSTEARISVWSEGLSASEEIGAAITLTDVLCRLGYRAAREGRSVVVDWARVERKAA